MIGESTVIVSETATVAGAGCGGCKVLPEADLSAAFLPFVWD
jgi:hypothetical protein